MTGSALAAIWTALGEDPAAVDAVDPVRDAVAALLPSPLPVGALAHDAIAAVSLLAGPAGVQPGDRPVRLDPARVATAYGSEKYFRRDGEAMNPWAPLSGFWPAADGWLRTHANYPHHRARLLTALGLDSETDPEGLARRLAELPAAATAEKVVAAGGIAAAVRSADEWSASDEGRAAAAQSLVARRRFADSDARRGPGSDPLRPLDGIRVLDLTRVLAGPIATRTLALLGADVLRIDPPFLDEPAEQYLDTGLGKRSLLLDLAVAEDRDRVRALLAEADVLVTGYRPGALDALGLGPDQVAATRPGLVVARLSAWGPGPWGDRRGFDSIVQAASGIAVLAGDTGRPGALPVQGLDHTAGYLFAAGILSALRARAEEGGSWLVETSLARISRELQVLPRMTGPTAPLSPTTTTRATPSGTLTYAVPAIAGVPADWPFAGAPFGAAEARWGASA